MQGLDLTTEESAYFRRQQATKIKTFMASRPELDHATVGLIRLPDGDYLWSCKANEKKKPTCNVCSHEMREGTLVDPDGSIGFPYWFCRCNTMAMLDRFIKERDEYRRQTETPQTVMDDILHKMDIPLSYNGKTLAVLKSPKAISGARQAMKDRSNILITGETGTGKTHLAVGLLIDYGRHKPLKYKFQSIPVLFTEIIDRISENGNQAEVIDAANSYEVLVLDDLGSGKMTDHRQEVLYHIVNSRGFDKKQTIITTNLSIKQINEYYGERLASRLCEYKEIHMTGGDYRKTTGKTLHITAPDYRKAGVK